MNGNHVYRFADHEVDTSRACLTRDGEEVHLRQKAFQVLVYLLERPGRVVPKDELFETVWKDAAVTEDALVQCVTEIRRAIGDNSRDAKFIKTVPKSGYRFIGEVNGTNGVYTDEVTRFEYEIEETESSSHMDAVRTLSRPAVYAMAGVLVATLVGAAFYLGWLTPTAATGGRSTVAVMLFTNSSGSTEFDWLHSGLPDMLAAGLSRSDKLSVLGQPHLAELLGRRETNGGEVSLKDAGEIARRSGAGHFITGSFAQVGDNIRVDVSLYAQNGELQGTETLNVDKPERLLSEVDLLSLKLANRLGVRSDKADPLVAVMTDDLEAYRFYSLAVEKAHAYKNAEAIELLEKAVARDGDFAMAHARIGYVYAVTWGRAEQGKPYLEKAVRHSAKLTEKDRLNVAAWYAIASLDYEAAIALYREIINRFPLEVEAYSRLARLLNGEDRRDEAVNILRQGLVIDPEAKILHNSLGANLSIQGKHDEAIAAHQRYVALAPNEPNAYDSLGLSYQWAGRYHEAIENYERALAIDPAFDLALLHRAFTRFRMGQYRAAIEGLETYIANAPSSVEGSRGYEALAHIYLRLGDASRAQAAAEKQVEHNPDAAFIPYLIAVLYGETDRANQMAAKSLQISRIADRGNRRNRRFETFYQGTFAMNNGRNEDAVEHFRQVLRHPATPWHIEDFEDCLGVAFLKLGRFDEAIAEFERILEINPDYPLAHFHIAEAYRGRGEPEQARTSYARFLEYWKDADADIPEVVAARRLF